MASAAAWESSFSPPVQALLRSRRLQPHTSPLVLPIYALIQPLFEPAHGSCAVAYPSGVEPSSTAVASRRPNTSAAGCSGGFWARRPGTTPPLAGSHRLRGDHRRVLDHGGSPAQIELTGGPDLVETSDRTIMRSGLDDRRVPGDLLDDLCHGSDEAIERGFRFGLGRLDHQRLGHDQWKVDGRRVKPEVDEALGDIFRRYPVRLGLFCGEDELVHRGPAEGVVE